jgi:hypothetical protein
VRTSVSVKSHPALFIDGKKPQSSKDHYKLRVPAAALRLFLTGEENSYRAHSGKIAVAAARVIGRR